MEFEFYELYPDFIANPPVLISGRESESLGQNAFVFGEDSANTRIYEIRYEFHCSPFQQAELNEGVLAVGHEQHFYLFDTNSNTNILRLEMDGYFGSFQLLDGWYYVADATGLWCIDAKGSVIWHSEELGMDGVIVSDILGDKIMGSGEWDPPGGWRDFEIDRQSGEKISDTAK